MRVPRVFISLAALASMLAAAGCGQDFHPPAEEDSGIAASALGAEWDLDLTLPMIVFPGRSARGAFVELGLRVEGEGEGTHPAALELGRALAGGEQAPIENLGSPTVPVTQAAEAWTTGRIGPLSLAGTSFELVLRGTRDEAGLHLNGAAWESQNGADGTFTGLRRRRFLLAGTDFTTAGWVESVTLRRGATLDRQGRLAGISADPVVRASGGFVGVINRLGFDNLQRLDPARDWRTAWQRSVGEGANPHDLLADPAGLFVTRYEPPFNDVLLVDPSNGEPLASVPVEELAENADRLPRADRLARSGGFVFAGLQDIDRSFSRYSAGKLAVIDPAVPELAGVIVLPGENPGRLLPWREDGQPRLLVVLAGVFPGLLPRRLSGGVAVVDPGQRVFLRWALDDDVAGGNIIDAAVAADHLAYALVLGADFVHRVIAFDPSSGSVLRTVHESRDFIPEIALAAGGILAVPDRAFVGPGLCLYAAPLDGGSAERALGCVETELPPASVVALD